MSSISRWVLEVRWLAGGPQTGRTPDTRIETIRVADPLFRPASHIKKLCYELCTKLNISVEINDSAIHIRDEFYGEDDGTPLTQGIKMLKPFMLILTISQMHSISTSNRKAQGCSKPNPRNYALKAM